MLPQFTTLDEFVWQKSKFWLRSIHSQFVAYIPLGGSEHRNNDVFIE